MKLGKKLPLYEIKDIETVQWNLVSSYTQWNCANKIPWYNGEVTIAD